MATRTHAFVTHLEGLRENRAALAALRRGLGQPPGTVPAMYPYVVPWLPEGLHAGQEAAYYLIAALFAAHPAAGGVGNMGSHLGALRSGVQERDAALERRFTTLLAAHPDDLPFYLRQAVSLLRSKEVPINWHQLYSDVLAWGHPRCYVQQRWARSLWR